MTDRPTVVRRARTNWRQLLAFLALAAIFTAVLYFAPSNETRTLKREVRARGTPCVEQHDGRPSPGCNRLLRLLFRECADHRRLCARAARRVLLSQRRLLRLEVIGAAEGIAPRADVLAPAGGRMTPQQRSGPSNPPGRVSPPRRREPPRDPPPDPPRPGGGLNGIGNSVNDVTEDLGLGRPVPPLPLPVVRLLLLL